MQNISNKTQKGFQDFEKYLKFRFVRKQSVSKFLLFQDFLRFEKLAKILGFTFLKDEITPPNKWLKLNSLILYPAVVIIFLAQMISIIMSVQQKSFFVTMENVMILGGYVIAAGKLFIIFHYKRDKIDDVIETLDKHFPHFGVDQLIFKVQKYLNEVKLFEKIQCSLFLFSLWHVTFFPFEHQIYGFIRSEAVEWETVLTMILPFDQFQPAIYIFMRISETWILMFTCFIFICTDLIFASLTLILSMEFDILGQVISAIDMIHSDEKALKELKKLIGIHQELIEVSEKISDIFSGLLLINSFASILVLCISISGRQYLF
ncbi:unnamed protein product [Chironomus riparius]|uniref:Odorant receptor n=1 Tax=Chironomus riparius TaxID=315576 RepID=A0A9N9WV28_9DIPT|nr:unnamed protein product [Chironomus riparius]